MLESQLVTSADNPEAATELLREILDVHLQEAQMLTFALAALVVVLLVLVMILALSALEAAKDVVHREGR